MNILFLCVANSARSQIAEGLAKHLLPDTYHIESAGSDPSGKVHPIAIQVMQENGIDISHHKSKYYEDFPEAFKKNLDYVITLCAEESCPAIASSAKKLHWALPDPASAKEDQQVDVFRKIRDAIEDKLREFHSKLS